jgi:hypothetical protein
MENLSDEQLDALEKDFKVLHDRAERVLSQIDESRQTRDTPAPKGA